MSNAFRTSFQHGAMQKTIRAAINHIEKNLCGRQIPWPGTRFHSTGCQHPAEVTGKHLEPRLLSAPVLCPDFWWPLNDWEVFLPVPLPVCFV